MSNDEPAIDEVVAAHRAKKDDVQRAWKYAAILGVALVAISVLSTLLWVNSQDNVDKLAESNDAGISQFEYCKKAPKTDPRCQNSVSQPAEKIVSGPAGVQGVQGIQGREGREGPQGVQGPQGPAGPQGPPGQPGVRGLPGNSPACLLEPSRCVGSSGADGAPGPQGAQGPKGDTGEKGATGPQGEPGADSTVPGPAGPTGSPGPQGEPGTDIVAAKCAEAGGTVQPVDVSGDNPATVEVEPMVKILTCVLK